MHQVSEPFNRKLENTRIDVDPVLTHQSPNGEWGTTHVIRSQEQVHWFLGLRQSEVTIRSLQEALSHNQRLLIKARSLSAFKRRRIRWLSFWQFVDFMFPAIAEELANLRVEAEGYEDDMKRLDPLIRDCMMELSVAEGERERIERDHPEVKEKTFEQLQGEYGRQSGLAGVAFFLASEIFSARRQLPSSVGHTLLELRPEEREAVLAWESDLRLQLEGVQVASEARETLLRMPPDQQADVLALACQIVSDKSNTQQRRVASLDS